MDSVYNASLLPYSSGTICFKEFFEKAREIVEPFVQDKIVEIEPHAVKKSKEDYMLPLLGDQVNSKILHKLSAVCQSNKLFVPGQPDELNVSVSKRKRTFEKGEIPKGTGLETLKTRAARQGVSLRFLRYTPSIWLDHIMSDTWGIDANRVDLIPGESLVVIIKVYHPFKYSRGEPQNRIPTPVQEIAVLGTNTLAEFRDKITCISDSLVQCDVSDNPSMRGVEKAADKYPSGMFYIANNFYIDKRNPKCIDYSETVKAWSKTRNIKLGETFVMEETKFEDMSARLGYPYLYQHQGNCEHLFCFTDVRILHESDPLQSAAYPLITCYFRKHDPHCMCCTNSVARWLTTGNARLPHDPFYFCEDCFVSYNYIDGKKIGEFKAYPFVSCGPEDEEQIDQEHEEQDQE